MARIAGVDLPREKRIEIGLTYIDGNVSAATKIKVMKIQKISWISYNAEKALYLPGYFFFNVLFATFYLKYSTPDSKI